jgi:outer membrane protein TolC
LRQALAHQPALQGARFHTEATEARVTQASAIEFPQVHATAQVFGATDNGTATAYLSPADIPRVATRPAAERTVGDFTPFVSSLAGVGAHYDVLDFGYTRGTVGAAQAQLESDQRLEQQTLQDVLYRVTTAYYAAVAAQDALTLEQDSLKRSEEHDAYAQARVKGGLAPPIDLPRSQADVQAAKLGVIRAQNGLRVERAALDTAIGWTPPSTYSLVRPPEDQQPIPEQTEATNQALSTRYDLSALQAQERAAEMQRMAANSGHYPRLIATGSVNLRGFDSVPETFNYDVGLLFDLPIFTGFAVTGQVRESEARLAELKAKEAAIRDAITFQLRRARETLSSAREAEVASAAEVEAAKASLKLAEVRYQQGLGNIVELTDAEAQFDVAQLGLVQSQLSAAVSRAQLDYALGQMHAPQGSP